MTILSTFGAGGDSGVDTGDIGHSLRFRRAGPCYMQRQNGGSDGNRKAWTLSFWLKPSRIETVAANTDGMHLFMVGNTNPNGGGGPATYSRLILGTVNNALCWTSSGSSGEAFQTSNYLRDVTSPVHVVVQADHANTTIKCYINGVEASYTSRTNPTNTDGAVNRASYYNSFGIFHTGDSRAIDGYVSRLCFVGGSVLPPSSFGYFNTEINEWVSKSQSAVKAVVDAGGTNSFMLDFDDATSLTTLGYDKSTKGNNWTLNNFSLTAGTTYDHMLDVPGNSFATLNPLSIRGTTTFSAANLDGSITSVYSTAVATQALSSGKWYWETVGTSVGNGIGHGVVSTTVAAASMATYLAGGVGYDGTGTKYVDGTGPTAYGATFTNNDVIGTALDLSVGEIQFYKNGVGQGVITLPFSASWFPAITSGGSGTRLFSSNFGQAPLHASATYDAASGGYFRYAPPTGFKALCQRNMPDPAILNPEKHFDVLLHTGSGASQNVTGALFQPDLAWVKCRGTGSTSNVLTDSIRGVTKSLYSDLTAAEETQVNMLTAFLSNGITVGADGWTGLSARTYVDWLWKAGGAAVTNNAGSISSQVSANVEAGFSIVTYTGTGANATVGHGLGKAPGLVIVKNISAVLNWNVYHSGLTSAAYYLKLDLTDAQSSNATVWNSTAPTSSVFSVGSAANTNGNTNTHVAYCFAEIPGYSKIFSFEATGTSDGSYVDCGFKPKFVMVKRTNTTSEWATLDGTRSPDNVANEILNPNLSNAESTTGFDIDFGAFGFKCRTAFSGTWIGIAFADVAGKYSLGR